MNEIFHIVFLWLQGLAWLTNLSYREINIIVFYIIVPVSWVFLYELPKRKYKNTVAAILQEIKMSNTKNIFQNIIYFNIFIFLFI